MDSKVKLISAFYERIPSDSLDNIYTEKVIRNLLKNVYGIYALFKDNNLYYIGKGRLYTRIFAHYKKDRHEGKWDTFAFAVLKESLDYKTN